MTSERSEEPGKCLSYGIPARATKGTCLVLPPRGSGRGELVGGWGGSMRILVDISVSFHLPILIFELSLDSKLTKIYMATVDLSEEQLISNQKKRKNYWMRRMKLGYGRISCFPSL